MEVSAWELIGSCDLQPKVTAFADALVENFFLPCKTSFHSSWSTFVNSVSVQ